MRSAWNSSFLYGGNAPYIEDQYERYLADAAHVLPQWREYFGMLETARASDGSDTTDVAHKPVIDRLAALSRQPPSVRLALPDHVSFALTQLAAQALVAAYRSLGHRESDLDPLRWTPAVPWPELAPAWHGITDEAMFTKVVAPDTYFGNESGDIAWLAAALRQTYCGRLGTEFMHLASPEQRRWWQMRLESTRSKPRLSVRHRLRVLDRLTDAEGLEKYLHTRFVGQQRFSLEGGEALIALLDELIHAGAARDVRHVVIGMAHRGRLNVLVNIAGKPAAALFEEFQGEVDSALLSGDVKYHEGFTGTTETDHGPVEVILAFNPSHLEVINPVVQGFARAKVEALGLSGAAVLPVEIHGDAAVIAQGIVQETLNLSYTRGHGTGGTIHVVVNNQLGFTTSDPRDARSSYYCTDIAKMIEAPVLHVNADDPQAVVHAAQLAVDYRAEFGRSVVIEFVCFRRHGHQEQDTPAITQPLMYRAIAAHPGVRALYAKSLQADGLVDEQRVTELVRACRERLDAAFEESSRRHANVAVHGASTSAPPGVDRYRAPALERLERLADAITRLPPGYALHPLVQRVLDARREMARLGRPLDWGMAEHLALADLLCAGLDVRLTGQDSERGTFAHRHAVLHNQNREQRGEGRHIPLQHVGAGQGAFRVTNSTLSEAGVLAFEYGYSVARPASLVLWEAQYGDFANGAQVVIDQFISAGFAKWGQRSSLVMLLPHGQEGQGPEHASARLERYLQLCAQDNLFVCQPTTPAQYFHLLRAQTLAQCRPLVVMTPKSLLRNPAAVSNLAELSDGCFEPMLDDPAVTTLAQRSDVRRIVLCTGKVYYELAAHRIAGKRHDAALVRIERLYPFPHEELDRARMRYPNAESLIWCQEEAQNQGAWNYVAPCLHRVAQPLALRYVGPPAAASTSPGYAKVHAANQAALLRSALEE
jgi:2-oxoglutarate dehydrogenase E1 component